MHEMVAGSQRTKQRADSGSTRTARTRPSLTTVALRERKNVRADNPARRAARTAERLTIGRKAVGSVHALPGKKHNSRCYYNLNDAPAATVVISARIDSGTTRSHEMSGRREVTHLHLVQTDENMRR
jgi:hypothetical protein